ncbi:MAG: Arm DNA-binding domain-containing protein [Desulfovibrio sp.]|nr:Arm DNA-binding domain-containing protein [Desulfovibrio sp.]
MYRPGCRQKVLSLGPYPDVSLKNARDKRDAARSLIANGGDPSVNSERCEKDAGNKTFNLNQLGTASDVISLYARIISLSILSGRLAAKLAESCYLLCPPHFY